MLKCLVVICLAPLVAVSAERIVITKTQTPQDEIINVRNASPSELTGMTVVVLQIGEDEALVF